MSIVAIRKTAQALDAVLRQRHLVATRREEVPE
jgi:hypothetical protein